MRRKPRYKRYKASYSMDIQPPGRDTPVEKVGSTNEKFNADVLGMEGRMEADRYAYMKRPKKSSKRMSK